MSKALDQLDSNSVIAGTDNTLPQYASQTITNKETNNTTGEWGNDNYGYYNPSSNNTQSMKVLKYPISEQTMNYWTKIIIYEIRFGEGKTNERNDVRADTNNFGYVSHSGNALTPFSNFQTTDQKLSVPVQATDFKNFEGDFTTASQYFKLNHFIALPYPSTAPETNYQINWSAEEWGIMGDVLEGYHKLKQNGLVDFSTFTDYTKWAEAAGIVLDSGAKKILQKLAQSLPLGGGTAFKRFMGFTNNDRSEYMFNNVEQRVTSLSWQFYPKCEEDTEALFNIISLFKTASHPRLMEGVASNGINASFLAFPALFEVEFMRNDKPNFFMPKFSTSALVHINVNNYASGKWEAHKDGSPLGLDLQLTFREIHPLVRESFSNDSNGNGKKGVVR